jgi:hypothetical protein
MVLCIAILVSSCSRTDDTVSLSPAGTDATKGAGVDLDLDGYASVESGGRDCVDQLSSVYLDGVCDCDASAPPQFIGSLWSISDHSWMQDPSGIFHLYFQANSPLGIEHYVSTNLQSIAHVRLVLSPNPQGWDSYGLWAPHVVQTDSLYYMFYTGVTAVASDPASVQRIGLAVSSDLANWSRVPWNDCPGSSGEGCVYDCDESWTAWAHGGPFDAQCRDPFVIWDANAQVWTLFVTARLNWAGPASQGIIVATSTDLVHWTGRGFIAATARLSPEWGGSGAQLTGGEAENPFIMQYGEQYVLLFTDWRDAEDEFFVEDPRTMVQYAVSNSLAADTLGSANWAYAGYTPDPGVNAIEVQVLLGDTWIMSQSVANEHSGDFPAHQRDLRLKRVVWDKQGGFTTSNLTKLSCRVSSASINPGAREICGDGIDNDCSGSIDGGAICAPDRERNERSEAATRP